MYQGDYTIIDKKQLTASVYEMTLMGDASALTAPGQFINIKIDGLYLRRPISVCDYNGILIKIIFKVVGKGTEILSQMNIAEHIDCLCGLGNGYDTEKSGSHPLLLGGGVGVPPLYNLCKKLISEGKSVTAVLGFNTESEVFYEAQFRDAGAQVFVCTADGSYADRGFVTDIMKNLSYSYVYTCGPEPMLKAVHTLACTGGQYSFEERMGCGFGACMGCSCKTKYGSKRICKDGPVLYSEEIIW